jgi:methionyl-tRNA formyltransferase
MKLNFAFFGTSEVSVYILEELKKAGFLPALVVTMPDKPQGRKFVITPPEAKVWAIANGVEFLQPEKLDDDFTLKLSELNLDLTIVVAYGKIMPKKVLDLPKFGSINVHYSLLPKLRGSSPVEGAILSDMRETGVSIILMDEKMDHGPLLAQEEIELEVWPIKRTELMNQLNLLAGKLLIKTISDYINGKIVPQEQNHNDATFVKMIKKEDALLDLNDEEYLNYRKILAYERWPRAYFIKDGKRVIVNEAKWIDGKLQIKRVTPEGKKEMNYNEFSDKLNP